MMTKVLITVMTYPTLSKNHLETVCTAGFKEDGSWIRIYPVPHRLLGWNKKYRKWQYIEVDLEKNLKDSRPESYHIRDIDTLKVIDKEDNGKVDWSSRMSWIKKGKKIYDDMSEILQHTKEGEMSLAVLKPTEFIGFEVEKEKDLNDYNRRLKEIQKKYEADQMQLSLFEDKTSANSTFEFAKKIPYKFYYKFKTKDGIVRRLMIEDWEIGMLYLKCLKNGIAENEAIRKVREKYEGFIKDRDVYLLIGTQYKWQNMNAKDPYVIIGVFYPPKGTQAELLLPF